MGSGLFGVSSKDGSCHWSLFLMETECIFCAVRNESLDITKIDLPKLK